MKYLIDPQTLEPITCERCDYFPATHELEYTDNGEDACDFVCSICAAKNSEPK